MNGLTSYLVLSTVKGSIVTAATDLADAPIKTDSNGFLDVLKQTSLDWYLYEAYYNIH